MAESFILIPERTHHGDDPRPPSAAALHGANVLAMSHADMARLGIEDDDLVRVSIDWNSIDVLCKSAELPAGIVAMSHEMFERDTRSDKGIEVTVEPI